MVPTHPASSNGAPAHNRVFFFDTTLRDGEQSPGCTMHHAEKLRMAHQLASLGVDILEAGFAIASDGDSASIRAIARELGAQARGPVIASLARCKREDIEAAARSIEPAARGRIHTFLSTSDLHLAAKLKITREQAIDQIAESVALARSFCDDVEFSPEDATRTDPDFLVKVCEVAIEAGATTLNLPDTVGYCIPQDYAAMFRMVRARVPRIDADGIILSAHCHDDLGLAVANSIAAIEAGVRQVECAINGIGERAGNAALEEIAAILTVRHDKLPYTHHIVMNKLYPTSQMLAECISFGAAPNKAIVGANAFAHAAGIHQHGVNPLTYEIMTPESVGVAKSLLVLGKHSGRRALEQRYAELGHPLTRAELDAVYHRFTQLADRKKSIYDQDLIALLQPEKSAAVQTSTVTA
jgi:2-isopropylmalate synthase